MSKQLLFITLVPILILSACTKKETVQKTETEIKTTTVKEEYTPEMAKVLAVWKLINSSPTDTIARYHNFMDNGFVEMVFVYPGGLIENYFETLSVDTKTIYWDGNTYAYDISGDTLYLRDNPYDYSYRFTATDSGFTTASLFSTASVSKSVNYPMHLGSPVNDVSLGINGDFVYFSDRYPSTYRLYKFNTLTGMNVDSGTSIVYSYGGVYYRAGNGEVYNSRYNTTYNLYKRTGITGGASTLSSNGLSLITTVSMNPNSGTIYASDPGGRIYSGSAGGSFAELININTGNAGYKPSTICYYKDDQFLGIYNGKLVLFKIAPKFEVIKTYEIAGVNSVYSMGTNGSDIWVTSYDNLAMKWTLKKITLN